MAYIDSNGETKNELAPREERRLAESQRRESARLSELHARRAAALGMSVERYLSAEDLFAEFFSTCP